MGDTRCSCVCKPAFQKAGSCSFEDCTDVAQVAQLIARQQAKTLSECGIYTSKRPETTEQETLSAGNISTESDALILVPEVK